MSSVSDWSALALMLLGIPMCDRHPPDVTGTTGAMPVSFVVGPTPGPPIKAGPGDNPFAPDEATLNAGRLYFQRYNCGGCHGDHAGGGMGPSLRDDDWIYGGKPGQIFSSIAEGRAHGMPAWGTKLPDDVIWKLVSYIASLRTPSEPDQPDQTVPAPPEL